MKLSIKNLGIVESAEIDLKKKLTLFCGPNGTGKTYVAYLLNALMNLKADVQIPINLEVKENLLRYSKIAIKPDYLRIWAKHIGAKLSTQLPSIFGVSPKEAEKMFKATEINLIVEENDYLDVVNNDASFFYFKNIDGNPESFHILKEKKNDTILIEGYTKIDSDVSLQKIVSEISSFIFQAVLLSNNGSRMLTVERNSIYTFKTELLANRLETVDNVLIHESKDAGEIIRQRATLYPMAVRNSLKVANELAEIIKRDTEYSEFATEIETQLLSGSVSVGKEGDVRFQPISTTSKYTALPLPIQLSSSSVKTLSGLVIYLRHIARKGDVLIIDEPEMNLHPDNQRRLARIFARMANKGIRLIISTHSDYIIRELNILVMYHALLSKKYAIDSGYSSREAINKDWFQAYLFDFNSNQKINATPISIDNFGLEVHTIDRTIEEQNEQTLIFRDSLEEIEEL